MQNLIPQFIREQFAQGKRAGSFEANTLFIDISGFTAMTETVMHHQQRGVEELTHALNSIFNPLVQSVYTNGGFISTFAGDAFTAIFPEMDAHYAVQSALEMQAFIAAFAQIQTPFGMFPLTTRVGLGAGLVEWGIVGMNGRYTYYFRGAGIDGCAIAERFAQDGEVIATAELINQLSETVHRTEVGEFARLERLAHVYPHQPIQRTAPTRNDLTPFLLESIIDLTLEGEFRDVVGIFIQFEPERTSDSISQFFQLVLAQSLSYGGYFNKLMFNDHHGEAVVLFGAPRVRENDLERATNFLLALKQQNLPIRWRAGFRHGLAFAGFVGCAERSEYTAIGDMMNLASRITYLAEWGEVWVPAETAVALWSRGYSVERIGEFEVKGKEKPVLISRLLGRDFSLTDLKPHQRELIGRDWEQRQLIDWLQPIFNGQCAGLISIYGEAGMGKSHLLSSLRPQLTAVTDLHWFICATDEILRQPLNPFIYFIRNYFKQTPEISLTENRARFDEIFDQFLQVVQTDNLKTELTRTKPFLGALVNLTWQGSLYEQVEGQLRQANTFIALRTFFMALSQQKPLIIQIEDAHWFDATTQQFLLDLLPNLAQHPVAVLVTSRYLENDQKHQFVFAKEIPQYELDLYQLTQQGVRSLAMSVLDAQLSEALLHYLEQKTEGNPFFVEQLLLDLKERALIYQDGYRIWQLMQAAETAVPHGLKAVLLARLDRLSTPVKLIVQTAAI